MADAAAFPAVSIPEAYAILTAPGMPFEMETIQIRGRADPGLQERAAEPSRCCWRPAAPTARASSSSTTTSG